MDIKDLLKVAREVLDVQDYDEDYPEDEYEEFIPERKPLPRWFKWVFVLGIVIILIGLVGYYYYTPPPEYAIWDARDPDADYWHIPLEEGTYELWVFNYKGRRSIYFEVTLYPSYGPEEYIEKTEDDIEYSVTILYKDTDVYKNRYMCMGQFKMKENGTVRLVRNQDSAFLIIPDRYPERVQYLVGYYFILFGAMIAFGTGVVLLADRYGFM